MSMHYTEIFFSAAKTVKLSGYIFSYFAQNLDCGYTLEPPRRGGLNKYLQSMFWIKNVYPVYPSFTV